ncbi:MAG: M23 family metallopeptidase [Microscillaceae bacterium]|jgi:hypothetical protein|nr:M23 family metallopeptidase [Microscillaceae bacterium]
MRLILLLCFGVFGLPKAVAQNYLFPINPGKVCYLAGNVGEIRQQHFHAGLDIAVDIGTKVYSSADGYISRIKVSPYGYGKVIYVVHPQTNQQTVYGHLNGFGEGIAQWVRNQQYTQAQSEIDLFLKPNQLPVKRGQVIAFSGNTGSSGGPHLHYEVRTMNDIALNPFAFGFKEIPNDNLPPIIRKIALQTLQSKARVNQQFGRFEFIPVKIAAGQYEIKNPIQVNGWVGLEVLTEDILQGRPAHTYAVNKIEVKLDGAKIFVADFNRIAHETTRSMYAHVNFPIMRRSGKGFQKCYIADGNRLKINYESIAGKGKIQIKDEKLHTLTVKLWDSWGNVSQLKILLKGSKSASSAQFVPDRSLTKNTVSHYISENTLVIQGNYLKKQGKYAILSFNGINQILPLAYMQGKQAIYLWNLQDGLPDYVEVDGIRKTFNFRALVPSEVDYEYKDKNLKIFFPKQALFDTLFLETQVWKNFIRLSSNEIPLYQEISLKILPNSAWVAGKSQVFWNNSVFLESYRQGGWLHFKTRNLGLFQMKPDISPPIVKLLKQEKNKISFSIRDDLSEISSFTATLNGKFLLLDYEPKANFLQTQTQYPNQNLQGNLLLEVKDGAGNRQILALILQ